MRVRMRWSLDDDDVASLSKSIEDIRGISGANIRLDHSGYGIRRVTISALVNGKFKIDWTGLGHVKIFTTSSGTVAIVATGMMKMLGLRPHDRPRCQADGHWGYGEGLLNADGVCQRCWVKAGNDKTGWIPSGIDEETWASLEVKPLR